MSGRKPEESALTKRQDLGPSFDLLHALPGRTSSPHTHRAYYRWIDVWLADHAGLPRTRGDKRIARMRALPLALLRETLSAARLRAWLGWLAEKGQSRPSIDQARAAVVTLTQLLVEAGWLDDVVGAAMANVRSPRAAGGQRRGRWLGTGEINRLVAAGKQAGNNRNQRLRNHLVLSLMCTLALRREELAGLRPGDFSVQNGRPVLRVRGKGNRVAMLDLPASTLEALQDWHQALSGQGPIDANAPLLRRLWKGGRISDDGLSTEGIWHVVNLASRQAGLGHVAPHDLRRSVAGALQEAGVTVDVISRLLRHGNVAVTERYLSRLPQRNEGGVLMEQLLAREDQAERARQASVPLAGDKGQKNQHQVDTNLA